MGKQRSKEVRNAVQPIRYRDPCCARSEWDSSFSFALDGGHESLAAVIALGGAGAQGKTDGKDGDDSKG